MTTTKSYKISRKVYSLQKKTDSLHSIQQQESVDTAVTVGSNILSDMLTKGVVNYHLQSSS